MSLIEPLDTRKIFCKPKMLFVWAIALCQRAFKSKRFSFQNLNFTRITLTECLFFSPLIYKPLSLIYWGCNWKCSNNFLPDQRWAFSLDFSFEIQSSVIILLDHTKIRSRKFSFRQPFTESVAAPTLSISLKIRWLSFKRQSVFNNNVIMLTTFQPLAFLHWSVLEASTRAVRYSEAHNLLATNLC